MTIMGYKKSKSPKGLSYYEDKLWTVFSKYIRLKNADPKGYVTCCSCGQIKHWKEIQSGHYLSRRYKLYKFSEINVHPQCVYCNKWLSGNPIEYRKFLINKYGESDVLLMETIYKRNDGFTKDGLLLKIKEYKKKLKELK